MVNYVGKVGMDTEIALFYKAMAEHFFTLRFESVKRESFLFTFPCREGCAVRNSE